LEEKIHNLMEHKNSKIDNCTEGAILFKTYNLIWILKIIYNNEFS